MPMREVQLPGQLVLVPGASLDRQMRNQARGHPGLPADPDQLVADLNARPEGVPATLSEPRAGSADWSVLIYGRSYLVRLFLTKKYQDAYTIAAISALRIRDHHRLAEGCLLLRPAGWYLAFSTMTIPQGSAAHWRQLSEQWRQLCADTRQDQRPVTNRQTDYLDTLDAIIDASQKITTEAGATGRTYPYRRVAPTGEKRYGTAQYFDFHLAGVRSPNASTFVQVHGKPDQRGQVTRAAGMVVTVRFDQPVDWEGLDQQGALTETPSEVVYKMQRQAVTALRGGQARSQRLLDVLVDHRTQRLDPADTNPAGPLDDDQLDAFRKAVAVTDLLLVLGPPGTGKTRTITEIARACASAGERVLVSSQNNRAVDNVLARLPRGLLAIRVGNDGRVTAEGQPYLLERQVAELRAVVGRATQRTVDRYRGIDLAGRWAGELARSIEDLTASLREEELARAGVDAARRAAGGPAQARVDQLTDRHTELRRAVDSSAAKVHRLGLRRDRARRRGGWPVFGLVFATRVRRLDRKILDERRRGDTLTADLDGTHAALEAARHELEQVTRADPGVLAALAAARHATEQRAGYREAALRAARGCRESVAAVEAPPVVRANQDLQTTYGELADLRAWLTARLPLLSARAALLAQWRAEMSEATEQLYPELIRYADVLAATCTGAGSRPELADVDFGIAIVDEAGQIGVADALVPLARARRGVLVGDHKQLPPFLDSEVEAWGAGVGDPVIRELLAKSALELLVPVLPDSHVVMLTRQRRMPAAIADFVSAEFYDGKLRTAVQREHRDRLFASPIAFIDTTSVPPAQRREKSGRARERWDQPGYSNPAEARMLAQLAFYYARLGAEWAIIVPYQAQAAEITATLTGKLADPDTITLNVGTVDSFQGGERDVILYGFTRSNSSGAVGFLRELRRINVAITRARRQLVLVGDLSTLTAARDSGFRQLATSLRDYVRDRGEICDYQPILDRLVSAAEREEAR